MHKSSPKGPGVASPRSLLAGRQHFLKSGTWLRKSISRPVRPAAIAGAQKL